MLILEERNNVLTPCSINQQPITSFAASPIASSTKSRSLNKNKVKQGIVTSVKVYWACRVREGGELRRV